MKLCTKHESHCNIIKNATQATTVDVNLDRIGIAGWRNDLIIIIMKVVVEIGNE